MKRSVGQSDQGYCPINMTLARSMTDFVAKGLLSGPSNGIRHDSKILVCDMGCRPITNRVIPPPSSFLTFHGDPNPRADLQRSSSQGPLLHG